MKWLVLLLVGAAVAFVILDTDRAEVEVEKGVTIALTLRPMIGLHGDWSRELSIQTPDGTLRRDLFEDTGWWRGSNLYRHTSGIYVLHEGQSGCVLFRVSPPEFVTDPAISCDKVDQADQKGAVRADALTQGVPASMFYRDFHYIGRFAQTPGGPEAIGFVGAEQEPETELPDIL